MTYEERVKALAEEMAAVNFPSTKEAEPEAWEGAVMHKERFARIAVKQREIGMREGLEKFFQNGLSEKVITDILIENGLIPSPGFHCNNKGLHFSDPGYKPVCAAQCEACKNYAS